MTFEEIYHVVVLLWLCFIAAVWEPVRWYNITIKLVAAFTVAIGAVVVALDILKP